MSNFVCKYCPQTKLRFISLKPKACQDIHSPPRSKRASSALSTVSTLTNVITKTSVFRGVTKKKYELKFMRPLSLNKASLLYYYQVLLYLRVDSGYCKGLTESSPKCSHIYLGNPWKNRISCYRKLSGFNNWLVWRMRPPLCSGMEDFFDKSSIRLMRRTVFPLYCSDIYLSYP